MADKVQLSREKCTMKQSCFVDLIYNGVERGKAYRSAKYTAKTLLQAQQNACRLLTKNAKVKAYLKALKDRDDANLQRSTNITRTSQLNRLDKLYLMAISQQSPQAANQVLRHINEMLGFLKEPAKNEETAALDSRRIKEAERIAQIRLFESDNDTLADAG